MKRSAIPTLVVTGSLLLAAAHASAQPTLTGIRASIADSQLDGTVDLDVTIYTSPALAPGTMGGHNDGVGWLGSLYTGTYTFLFSPFHYTFQIEAPAIHGIEWGDASTLDDTTIPFVSSGPPRTFRGSFSHTYPDTSVDHLIRVGSFGLLGYPDGVPSPGYDNQALPPSTANPVTASTVRTHYRISNLNYGTTASGDYTFAFDFPYVVGLTNTVSVPASLFGDTLEIPSLSRWGVLLLALAMAGLGAFLLRR